MAWPTIVKTHTLRADIPELDYTRLATLDGCVEYFTSLGTSSGKERTT